MCFSICLQINFYLEKAVTILLWDSYSLSNHTPNQLLFYFPSPQTQARPNSNSFLRFCLIKKSRVE